MSVETAAFVKLVNLHDRELRMLAYRILQDRMAMDDVMQDAYLKAFRGFPDFRGQAQARTWIYRIVYNACLDRLRSNARRRAVPLESWAEVVGEAGDGIAVADCGALNDHGTLDPAESVVLSCDLAAALASLPPDQRAAVLLVDAAGFAYEEAAQVLGVRPGTIGSRLHQARSALRTTLAEGSGNEEVWHR